VADVVAGAVEPVIDIVDKADPAVAPDEDVFAGIWLVNAAVSVVARQSSVVDPFWRLCFDPGGQTLAGILQKGDPGTVTLSQMRPSLAGQQLWPHKLDINSKSTMHVGERAEGIGGAGILYKGGYMSVGREIVEGNT
jgi:hypothetical protein